MTERILPPFPNELIEQPSKDRAIDFLVELGVPSRIARNHLHRWSQMTGVELRPSDFQRVSMRPKTANENP